MSKLKYFFPDSQDFIDPSFDFVRETRNEHRVRQRDDHYPHEVFAHPYDGMLVSKAVVDGLGGGESKYTRAQRLRYFRNGMKHFFRLPDNMQTMGDCGAFTYVNQDVSKVITGRLGPSALIGIQAVLIGLAIGLILGILAAWKHNSGIDYFTMILAVLGVSVPNFVAAALLQYYIGLKWGVLPVGFWTGWNCSVLPSIALSFSATAMVARFMRTEMLDVLDQDYIVTARAKGLSQMKVLVRHAVRNSILPVVTILGPIVVNLMTGSLAVENIFSIPGIGSLFVDCIKANDYPVIMGITIFYAAFYMLIVLLVDLAYSLIDPRIRLAKGKES